MTHGPIPPEFVGTINTLAKMLDDALNPDWQKGKPRGVGFALLTYRFGENITNTGRVNYIGNGTREDVLVALKELVARWEGRHPEESGTLIPRQ